jgi:signal transduction histidine kinase
MRDERVRLARELHDGVLQSLTVASLQLEALSRLIDDDPKAAPKRLRDIEDLVIEEQRELRTFIQILSPRTPVSMASYAELAAALEKLCRRVESQWGLQVRLNVADQGKVPRTLGDEIYRLVQEALSNVARHAHAGIVRVEVVIFQDRVRIAVADDGRGFPFLGRYDLAELTGRKLGPRSLKDRVASMRGKLVLTSTQSGSLVEIILPLRAWNAPRTGFALRRE